MHLAIRGCVKGMDPFALHLLKTSQDPILRFRRWWMRETAIRQAIRAEKRQVKINDRFKQLPRRKGADIQQEAILDQHLKDASRHYANASWTDDSFINAVKREAPTIFPKR